MLLFLSPYQPLETIYILALDIFYKVDANDSAFGTSLHYMLQFHIFPSLTLLQLGLTKFLQN